MEKGDLITISEELISSKIMMIRNQKVMLDKDLAELYEVETKRLKEQVKRNIDRFPSHFMFELTKQENEVLRSQIATLKQGEHSKYLPLVFTEHGILMLSNVLKSKLAIAVSIKIIDVFVKIRERFSDLTLVQLALERLEKKTENNTKNIEIVFRYLDELIDKEEHPKQRNQIGYKTTT